MPSILKDNTIKVHSTFIRVLNLVISGMPSIHIQDFIKARENIEF